MWRISGLARFASEVKTLVVFTSQFFRELPLHLPKQPLLPDVVADPVRLGGNSDHSDPATSALVYPMP